jgi:hypothetical protein
VELDFTKGQFLVFADLVLLSFFNAFSHVGIKKSAIFTSHVNDDNGIGGNADFGMGGRNLSILNDDRSFFRSSTDDVFAFKERDFILKSGMRLQDDVPSNGSLALHCASLKGQN